MFKRSLCTGARSSGRLTPIFLAFAFVFALTMPLRAQSLAPVPPLSFTKPFAGADPLPQVLTIASTGAKLNFTASWSTATGGGWLSVSGLGCGGGNGGCGATPQVLTAIVNASPALAAGTYTGQIIVSTGATSITVPVSLTVAAPGTDFFDNVPGQVSFSLQTNGLTPPNQTLEIRNGGTGILNWTLTRSTADAGNWLQASAPAGTAPSLVSVTVVKQNLPGMGLVAGTFIGQLVFQTTGSRVTVPVSVVVADNVLSQVNAISFTKPFTGADPLPQVLTIASTGTRLNFTARWSTATGGNWLSVSGLGCGGGNGGCGATPHVLTAIVNASPTLPAGTYTGQIVVSTGSMSITVAVSLTVAQQGTPFFDNVPGQMSFSLQTGGSSPPGQTLEIRSGAPGTFLDWTLAHSTADGGNWLQVSAPSGTAPSLVDVTVVKQNLPGLGLIPGTFIGQLVFQAASSRVRFP